MVKDEVRLIQAAVAAITPSPDNCRVIREKDPAFVELVDSVKASGVLIPVHVRRLDGQAGTYELLAGERRWRAARAAGIETIPAIDHGELDEEAAFAITFTENYQRQDLTPLEEGKAAAVLLEKHRGDAKAAAAILGRSEKWVRTRAAIHRNLSKKWRKALAAKNEDEEEVRWMTAAHLALLARLPKGTQDHLYESDHLYCEMPVSEMEERINRWLGVLAHCPWDPADETLVPAAGSCARCTKRSGHEPGLFQDEIDLEPDQPDQMKNNEKCLDPACYLQKRLAHLRQQAARHQAEHPECPKLVWIAAGKDLTYHERREIQEACSEQILTTLEYQPAKKEAPGAKPAMIVDGKNAGKLQWIRPGRGSAATRSKKDPAETTGKTLKQRRAELDAKRWAQVLLDMQDRIDRAELADLEKQAGFDCTKTIPALAAVFGVEIHWYGDDAPSWKGYDALIKDSEAAVRKILWEKVRPELRKRLAYHGAITQTPMKLVEEAGRIGKLIGVEVEDLFNEVAGRKGFTEPKSWAGLKADGTPRAEKKKKATTNPTNPTKEKKATTEGTEKHREKAVGKEKGGRRKELK